MRYAIFNDNGEFVRFENLDELVIPPIPNDKNGYPRAKKVEQEPEFNKNNQFLTYSHSGWKINTVLVEE